MIKLLFEICDGQILPPSLYLHSLNSAFRAPKLLILMKSNLSICYFMDCAFNVASKRIFAYPKVTKVFPTVSHKFYS